MAGLFIFGSCVSRDAYAQPVPGISLRGYVARQSLISAFGSRRGVEIETGGISSAFQRRMVTGDLAGNLAESIEESADIIDIILWDLTDERMGVLEVEPGTFITPSEELLSTEDALLVSARHIAFGEDEHFLMFHKSAVAFAQWLREKALISSVLVINTPHSASLVNVRSEDEAGYDQEALSNRALAWNSSSARYYALLADIGFRVEALPAEHSKIDAGHRWGVAPFHYAEETYESMREAVDRALESGRNEPAEALGTWREIPYEDYLQELGGLWPNGLSVATGESGWEITLPNGQSIENGAEPEGIDWTRRFERDHATSTLWMRSLIYLPLLEEQGESELVDRLLGSYEDFMRCSVESPEFFRTNSLDHCVALNLQVLCHLRLLRLGDAGSSRSSDFASWIPLVSFLERLARDDRVFQNNNHGMFLCVSVLSSRWFWPEIDGRREPISGDEARLVSLLSESFSHEGVTVENTPHYQEIWVYLVAQARYVAQGLRRDELFAYLDWLHARIQRAFRVMLLPTGTIPPFGDGASAPPRELTPTEGVLYSPAVGLYVRHQGQDYFSIKCGSAKPVHKHMDDTSIYLMVDGVELISDMGLLNYDSFDNQANLVRGQMGHSSVAFRELDHLPQSFAYPASGEVPVVASMEYAEEGGVPYIRTRASLLGTYTMSRSVVIRGGREFLLRDSAHTRFGATAVQRFVLPMDSEIMVGQGNVIVRRLGKEMVIRFETPVSQDNLFIGRSPIGPFCVLEREISAHSETHVAHVSVFDDRE